MDSHKTQANQSPWDLLYNHCVHSKDNGMPKMTVVLPIKNQAHLLEPTLQSFIDQDTVDKELIIIDANSTDQTAVLLEKYKAHIARIYYVTETNLALMIHKGFSLANGHYVSFLLPGIEYTSKYCLNHLSAIAYENKNPEVVFSGAYITWPIFKKLSDAFKRSTDEIEPEFTFFPFNEWWLKRGFLPTAPYCIWFRVDYINLPTIKNYKKTSLKISFFEILCHIIKDPKVRIISTCRSTVSSDYRLDTRFFSHFDILSMGISIYKNFGVFNGLMWIFRKKPYKLLHATISLVYSFFREK